MLLVTLCTLAALLAGGSASTPKENKHTNAVPYKPIVSSWSFDMRGSLTSLTLRAVYR